MIDRNFKCKDCKFSEASFADRLFNFSAGFRCKIPESFTEEKYDPVTGKSKPGFYNYCSVMRIDDACGPKAKLWEPRHKKHLFLMLQKDYG